MAAVRGTRRRGDRIGAAEGFLQIGRGASITGKVQGSGVVLLHGRLSGEVVLDGDLVIAPGGEAAELKGKLDRLRVEGRCQGTLFVSGSVELASGGSFEGEVDAQQLETSEGACFDGLLHIRPDRRKAAADRKADGSRGT